MNKRKIGALYEDMAAEFLQKKGYVLLAKNYRCKFGEIDLVVRDCCSPTGRPVLVFAEVKYRLTEGSGIPEEAVSPRKQRTITRVADWYRMENRIRDDVPIRFDVVAIEGEAIRHHRDAFSYSW